MARRRLSDLLREEAKKPEDAAASATQEDSATQEASDREAGSAPESPAEASNPDSETLIAEIADLKAALAKSQQLSTSLQQKVGDLQTDLEKQQTQVKALKADLQKVEPLKSELEQAKSTALQLADANAKLTQELGQLKKPAIVPSQASQPQALAKPAATTHKSIMRQEDLMERQFRSLAHPVFPDKSLPGQLNDQDLGWVD